jgi:hypothetical protein
MHRSLYLQGKSPWFHWIGGWVGSRAVLDTVVKRELPSPRQESNPRIPIVQPVAQMYLQRDDSFACQFMMNEAKTLK